MVLVIVLPVFVHIVLNVPPLTVFDPVMQLCVGDVSVLVSVNAVDYLPVGRDGLSATDKVEIVATVKKPYASLSLLSSGVS